MYHVHYDLYYIHNAVQMQVSNSYIIMIIISHTLILNTKSNTTIV